MTIEIPRRPNEYNDEQIISLWDQYKAARTKQDKKELKNKHNELAAEFNKMYNRKVYVFIY